jgi:hypothetical protein
MFLLGLLSFFQTVFIPGFILLKYVDLVPEGGDRVSDGLRRLVYGFGFSLLINYLLVFYLTLVGIYTPVTFYIILIIEGLLLVYYWKYRRKPVEGSSGGGIGHYVSVFKTFTGSNSLLYNLVMFAALAVILVHVFYFFYFLGTVFMHWDPAVAWNRFAVEWSGNRLPANTWHYPQLMPANWSVSYVLMQNAEVQCFAKAIMPLFSIAVLLLFFELALRKRCSVYFVAAILYGGLLGYLYDPSVIVSGYVDIGVSFFAFLAFYAMHSRSIQEEEKNSGRYLKNIFTALVFACTAAVTKQAGLFILVIMLVWLCGSLFRHRKVLPVKKILTSLLLMMLVVLIITASWYILKEIHIGSGLDTSEIRMVQSVHTVDSYSQRFVRGIEKIISYRHPKLRFAFFGLLILILAGLFSRRSRWVVLFIVIPYTLIWGFFFSYDSRNLALAVPFMAYSAAFGTGFLKRLSVGSLKKLPSFNILRLPVIIGLLAVLVILNFTLFKSANILQHQVRQKMKLGEEPLNRQLYRYHEKEGIKGKIATTYLYLSILPELKQFFKRKPGRITVDFLDWLETEEGKDIHYLLMPFVLKSEKEVYRRFQQKLKSGEYRMIFKSGGYRFVDVRNNE